MPIDLAQLSDHAVIQGDNLLLLKALPDGCIDLIYIDPPFNTGKAMTRTNIKTVADPNGDRAGFAGKRYRTEVTEVLSYNDSFEDFEAFLRPRMEEAYRLLSPAGALYFHIDYREVHYCKVWLDSIFGRENFVNEIIWHYDYGAKPRNRWPAKHDNILYYVKDRKNYTFNYDAVDRIPYMAPNMAGPEKAAKGKFPTDTWFLTIVSPTGKEKTGYPTQKPIKLLRRILAASSNPGERVLDFFAGSGTTGAAALELGRKFILIDQHPDAIETMRKRFTAHPVSYYDAADLLGAGEQ